MMTGLFCMAVIQYAIAPIFQIEKKTWPLIAAARGRLHRRSAPHLRIAA